MKRIILIEPFDHREILYRWASVFSELAEELHFWVSSSTVITDAPTFIQQLTNIKWYFPDPAQNFNSFLQDHVSSINHNDILIWLTAGLRYDWLNILPKNIQIYLVVHNVQTLLCPRWCFPLNFRQLLSLSKYYLSGQSIYRRRLLARKPYLVLATSSLQESVLSLNYPKTKTSVWPFAYTDTRENSLNKQDIILIPGTVNATTRNYDLVLSAFSIFLSKWIKPVELVFLGSCMPNVSLIEQWNKVQEEYPQLSVRFFHDPIPQESFENYLEISKAILLPLYENFCFGPFKEQTGRTRISGGVFDALAYQIPLVLPSFYPLPNQQESFHYHTAEECASILIRILNREKVLPSSSATMAKQDFINRLKRSITINE